MSDTKPLTITRLTAENVKRLVAVSITPDGHVVTIGGKNGAGKSSVLDAIAYALGGASLVPPEPIRRGQAEATIRVDLGDLVATRVFKRDLVEDPERVAEYHRLVKEGGLSDAEARGTVWPEGEPDSRRWGPVKSTLVVTSKDGARYPSPQATLDRLLGALTFDPLAFATAGDEAQAVTLRHIAKIDTAALDEKRRDAFALRTDLSRQLKAAEARLRASTRDETAPKNETPVSTVTAELDLAHAAVSRVRLAESKLTDGQQAAPVLEGRLTRARDRVAELARQLEEAERQETERSREVVAAKARVDELAAAVETARAAVPDVEVTKRKLQTLERDNARVRANAAHDTLAAEVARLAAAVDGKTVTIEAIDAEKTAQLARAAFPIDGLGLDDAGVTWNGLPFKQASTAEQLRASVAIGLAVNPRVRVLLVRQGSALDAASMAALAAQAAAAGAQVWVERVSDDGRGCQVFIEDGAIAATVDA